MIESYNPAYISYISSKKKILSFQEHADSILGNQ